MRNQLFLFLTLLICACTRPAPPPQPVSQVATVSPPKDTVQKLNPVLTLTQMDSFVHLKGKPVSVSLWKLINVYQLKELPDTVGVLRGNLDQDGEQEIVIWYTENYDAWSLCFDRREQAWHFIGESLLDLRYGRHLPRIDPDLDALLTYSYPHGSGYGAEELYFSQYRHDSLLDVLHFTEYEFVRLNGSGSTRLVQGTYQVINKAKVLVHYLYEITADEEGHSNEVFFRRRFTIPYLWDSEKQQFQPHFSKSFARRYGLHREYSEYEFDGYFDVELERIRQTGPMWKRHALGSYPDY